MKKRMLVFGVLTGCALGVAALFGLVWAGVSDNVSGWAWGNPGWASFNCTNEGTCGAVDYGVRVDGLTGDFSGYAWSSSIGWVSFNRSDTQDPPDGGYTCPSGGTCIANLNLSVPYEVSGWARALAACPIENGNDGSNPYDDPCTSTTENAGGWDGWISMRGTWDDGVSSGPYGVTWNPDDPNKNELEGWAWGGELNVGWVSFNCENDHDDITLGVQPCTSGDYFVQVLIKQPPSIENFKVVPPDKTYCGLNYPPVSLDWDFVDLDAGDSQDAYRIKAIEGVNTVVDTCDCDVDANGFIDDTPPECTGNNDETTPVESTGANTCASGNTSSSYTFTESGRRLDWATTYDFELKVKDKNDGLWSPDPPATITGHLTPAHRFPWPYNFDASIPRVEGEPIQFSDDDEAPPGDSFDGDPFDPLATPTGGSCGSPWCWDFGDGNTSTNEDPIHTYAVFGQYPVKLSATDELGTCSDTLTLTVLPATFLFWKEVSPF